METVAPKFSMEASLSDVFQNVHTQLIDSLGNFEANQNENIIVECHHLKNTAISTLSHKLSSNAPQIFGMRFSGVKLSDSDLTMLVSVISVPYKFLYLLELDLSYLALSQTALSHLGNWLNPTKSGYCPLKRLIMTRTRLGEIRAMELLSALETNVYIEELLLNGNNIGDSSIPALSKFLGHANNAVRLLGIASNNITEKGLTLLASRLSSHPCLRDIQLHGNEIGNEGSDVFFKTIRDTKLIESVNLAHCGIVDCRWAGRLRIMCSLSKLSLSHNLINDNGFRTLCNSLEGCFSLRHLDLSSNMFGGRLCLVIGKVLEDNKGLLTLNLSNNKFMDDVWISVKQGLLKNNTLMTLDVQGCDLKLACAECICEAFAVNDTCTVLMNNNPLPMTMLTDPRAYRRSSSAAMTASKALCAEAPGLTLVNSHAWRADRLFEISHSKLAMEIVESIGSGQVQELLADDLSLSASVLISPGAARAKEMADRRDHANALTELYNSGRKILSVSYGHSMEQIGHIEVEEGTTYEQAKGMIMPLVALYLSAAQQAHDPSVKSLVQDFSLLDPDGKAVGGLDVKIRTVWTEASLNDCMVRVRPADWLSLPEEGPEDDGDYDDMSVGM